VCDYWKSVSVWDYSSTPTANYAALNEPWKMGTCT